MHATFNKLNLGVMKLPTKRRRRSSTYSLVRWNSNGCSQLTKCLSHTSISTFFIQGDPLRHEIMIQTQGQPVYYLRTTRNFFGKKLALYENTNDTPLYSISSHKILGFMGICSPKSPKIKLRFPYPRSSHGMYSVECEGCKFVWDYHEDKYLRCYDMSDASIIAELFWSDIVSDSSSCSSYSSGSTEDVQYAKYVAKVLMIPFNQFTVAKQLLILLTGLLILRNSIWRKDV
ncbi:hypothetical protein K493DRAFT_303481 [Basidiobolus meristosporus CBS 931.73]|uniref:Uncharacterized protein n=1 Tax=Basidiobolus meristosporus CBS 931.73 TaxID=1314790 RepID=A0A1Y1Y2G6_9FUNG|nr:hypothetical protein K493DRAFT_303481 [Basidiobolus meristosporus CBS 931.73]|eukprot:ORX92193.1 hypothetical protein K493DRAFT_303481 [Basidiobolus meristosporus CBS 931.73]